MHDGYEVYPVIDAVGGTSVEAHRTALKRIVQAGGKPGLGAALGELIAGDKKDLVLTNRLRTHLDRVAIYGWHTDNGKPIQSLSTVHGWRYADYSHGARLISTRVFVDGISRSIFDVIQDNRLAPMLSDEGVIGDAIGLIETLNARARDAMAAVVQDLIPRLAGSTENH
jgi:hypothetical protein